jgi:hypothetical protein
MRIGHVGGRHFDGQMHVMAVVVLTCFDEVVFSCRFDHVGGFVGCFEMVSASLAALGRAWKHTSLGVKRSRLDLTYTHSQSPNHNNKTQWQPDQQPLRYVARLSNSIHPRLLICSHLHRPSAPLSAPATTLCSRHDSLLCRRACCRKRLDRPLTRLSPRLLSCCS